ncbi:MAG: CHRD domain-containing protein [Comamonadaceae bacterium]|nr:MAG: CHRD domain-containing protein [Comamonadaceae bacterium]
MINRKTFLRTTLAASIVGIAVLSGCSSVRPSQTTTIFETTLSSANEVPPVSGYGTGRVEATWKPSNMTLSYRVTFSGLSGAPTAAHFHGPAMPGENAGVSLPVTVGTPELGTIQGEAVLTQAQADDLAAGRWYFNIHTAANPNGEVRGQMRRRG